MSLRGLCKLGIMESINRQVRNNTIKTMSKCPKCSAIEIEAITPRTVYKCGSSDYDQRSGTFEQSQQCKDNGS